MSPLPKHKSHFDKSLDILSNDRLNALDLGAINTLADSAPNKLLNILAHSFDVDISGLNEESARALIKDAFKMHFYSGTFYALKRALQSFCERTEILEWYEYDAKPYHFKLELEASQTGLNQESLLKTDEIVNEFKNVRSIYDGANIKISTKASVKSASYLIQGESISVLPFMLTNMSAKSPFYSASTFKQDETIHINLNLRT